VSFIRRLYTLAAISSVYGTKILEREGKDKMVKLIWDFDSHITELLALLPDFVFREATREREEWLAIMMRWEKHAKLATQSGSGSTNTGWSEELGLSSTLDRTKLCEDEGLSERGRAAVHVALAFGLTTNSVPTATWFAVNATQPEILPTTFSEIQASRTTNGGIDMAQLNKQTMLGSLLEETYRLSIYSFGLRMVINDTQVGPQTLRKGGLVITDNRDYQFSPSMWGPDPSSFNPPRFLSSLNESSEEQTASKIKRQKLNIFGGGSNICPGRFAAKNEIIGGLAIIMTMLEIEVIEGQEKIGPELKKGKSGGMWPDKEVTVRMRRRRS